MCSTLAPIENDDGRTARGKEERLLLLRRTPCARAEEGVYQFPPPRAEKNGTGATRHPIRGLPEPACRGQERPPVEGELRGRPPPRTRLLASSKTPMLYAARLDRPRLSLPRHVHDELVPFKPLHVREALVPRDDAREAVLELPHELSLGLARHVRLDLLARPEGKARAPAW